MECATNPWLVAQSIYVLIITLHKTIHGLCKFIRFFVHNVIVRVNRLMPRPFCPVFVACTS